MAEQSLLTLKNLTITIQEDGGERILVNDLNLEVPPLKIVALVGGSGSGKTTMGLSILRLLAPAVRIRQGEIIFKGKDLLKCSKDQMRSIRGKEMSMVFQEPLNAFNPVFTIGYQIKEVLQTHTEIFSRKIPAKIQELLKMCGIKDASRVMQSYPHQLSGGLRQRAMIAQAIAAGPELIIADEPTSNLDVTWQAHIMELFRTLRDGLKISMLLITHDLGMVAHLADRAAVLYDGKIVECGETKEVLAHPKHPFTMELMEAMIG